MIQHSITELRNRHRGQDLYVVASGSSLNHIDPRFFVGRIVIGVNEIHRHVPCTYVLMHHHEHAQEVLDKDVSLVIARFNCGHRDWGMVALDGEYYVYEHAESEDCAAIDLRTLDHDDRLAMSSCTTAEAVELAYKMGAQSIFLMGADGGTLDGATNIVGYNDHGPTQSHHLRLTEPILRSMVHAIRDRGVWIHSINPFINFGLEGHRFRRPVPVDAPPIETMTDAEQRLICAGLSHA